MDWDWLSLTRRVGVRFQTREICLARDSSEECRHIGQCFPWEWFAKGHILRDNKQEIDQERELAEEVANYLEAEEKGRCIDDTEPILHPPVHSIRKPYKVMYCSTLLQYN